MCLPQKEQLRNDVAVLLILSPYFTGLSLCFPQHKDIVHRDGAFDVPCEDSALVLAFENLDPDLNDFACDASPADDLNDFSRDDLFFSCLAHLSTSHRLLFLGRAL